MNAHTLPGWSMVLDHGVRWGQLLSCGASETVLMPAKGMIVQVRIVEGKGTLMCRCAAVYVRTAIVATSTACVRALIHTG